jgi:hypothetical protein
MTSFPLNVEVTPKSLQLKPGASGVLQVKITNVGDIVQHYQVTIVGLPSDEYWSTEPAVTKLKPQESAVIRVDITLPEKGGVVGQRYDLGVLVTSPYDANVSRSVDLALDVTAMPGITLTASPLMVYGKSSAAYALELTNNGNIDLLVDLVASDDQGVAEITLTPHELYIQPDLSQDAQLAVRAKSILTGQERRSTVAIKAQVDGETRGEAQVTFIQQPRVPPQVLRTLGIVLAVVVMAGAILLGGLLGRSAARTGAPSASAGGSGAPSGGAGGASPTSATSPVSETSPASGPTGKASPSAKPSPSSKTSPATSSATSASSASSPNTATSASSASSPSTATSASTASSATSESATGAGTSASSPQAGESATSAKPTVSEITVDPPTPLANVDVKLSAIASEGVTTWQWQILDAGGTEVTTSSNPQQLTFKFPKAGKYTVKLKVSDTAGQEADMEGTVEVTDQPK